MSTSSSSQKQFPVTTHSVVNSHDSWLNCVVQTFYCVSQAEKQHDSHSFLDFAWMNCLPFRLFLFSFKCYCDPSSLFDELKPKQSFPRVSLMLFIFFHKRLLLSICFPFPLNALNKVLWQNFYLLLSCFSKINLNRHVNQRFHKVINFNLLGSFSLLYQKVYQKERKKANRRSGVIYQL